MLVYRISSHRYARDLSGTGAAMYGGRWNPVGINLLYTAGSISLACLEYLAHNFHLLASQKIALAKIRIDPSAIEALHYQDLPNDWNEKSFVPHECQRIGLDLVTNQSCYGLKVPSVIVPGEHNYILNPLHEMHKQSAIEEMIDPFVLDQRLFGQTG